MHSRPKDSAIYDAKVSDSEGLMGGWGGVGMVILVQVRVGMVVA